MYLDMYYQTYMLMLFQIYVKYKKKILNDEIALTSFRSALILFFRFFPPKKVFSKTIKVALDTLQFLQWLKRCKNLTSEYVTFAQKMHLWHSSEEMKR